MVPAMNRFIGVLQGVGEDYGCGEALDSAESLLANGGFDGSELASIARAAGGAAGSSPLMRAIPFGLFYFRDPVLLRENTEKACRLTHTSPAEVAAAVGMARSVARLIVQDEVLPVRFVRETGEFIREIHHESYVRIHGLVYPLRRELPFLCSNAAQPIELLRAALYLFLSCPACDLDTEAERQGLGAAPVLPLAYALAGCRGTFCRLEKPSLRVLMVAEAFHKYAAAE
jgi:ADP-ribosylglycohydrolase